MPMKGVPKEPREWTPAPIPDNASWKEKREIKSRNTAGERHHEKAGRHYKGLLFSYNRRIEAFDSTVLQGRVPELAAAASMRDDARYSADYLVYFQPKESDVLYTEPKEFISDLWTEGQLEADAAKELIEEIDAEGKAGPKTTAMLDDQLAKGHILKRESELMRQYRQQEKAPVSKDDIDIRRAVMRGLTESGLSPEEALPYAAEIIEKLSRDPLDKASETPEPDSHLARQMTRRQHAARDGDQLSP